MKIRWKPTCIGGEVKPDDFCAYLLGLSVGRVYGQYQAGMTLVWNWSFWCGSPEFMRASSGAEPTSQAASEQLRQRIKLYLATPVEEGGGKGLEPEEMRPSESSDRLRWMKANRPEEFWKRIEDIRAGRVDRNYNRWIDDKSPLHALTEEDYV